MLEILTGGIYMTYESIQRVKKIAAMVAVFVLISGTAIAAPKDKEDIPKQNQQSGPASQDVNQQQNKKDMPKQGQQSGPGSQGANQQQNKKDMPKQNQQSGSGSQGANQQQDKKDIPKQNQQENKYSIVIREMRYTQGGNLLVVFGYPDGYGYPAYQGYPGKPGNQGKHYGNNIRWDKNERITIRDKSGRAYEARVMKSDRNVLEVRVEGLLGGTSYSINIGGIYFGDVKNEVDGEFWAKDNWKYRK
jgi:hypothetical protein